MASLEFNVGFLENERDELGFKSKDLAVAVEINKNNYDIRDMRDLDSVKDSLHNIFSWIKGERILNPLFGNPIIEYIYETITPETANKISSAIGGAIETWDGRIRVKLIDVQPDADNNQYDIKVYYDVPFLSLHGLEYNKIVTIEE